MPLTKRQKQALEILATAERPLRNKDFHERFETDGRRTTGWAEALGPCTKRRDHDSTSLWSQGLVTVVDNLYYVITDAGREVAHVMGLGTNRGNATAPQSRTPTGTPKSTLQNQRDAFILPITKPKPKAMGEQARKAVGCSYCFVNERATEWGRLPERPADRKDDVAVPPWVGEHYWDATPRVVVMMLNPGHATADHKLMRRDLGHNLRDRTITYEDYNKQLIKLVPQWGFGAVLRWLQAIELEIGTIAFLNMALCAVANDKYFSQLFETCFAQHTRAFLVTLAPDVVILCGKRELAPYANAIESLGPKVLLTWHYRPMNTTAGKAELQRVRRELDALRPNR
jgi:hypothetical protein